jgi:hypothetical protein
MNSNPLVRGRRSSLLCIQRPLLVAIALFTSCRASRTEGVSDPSPAELGRSTEPISTASGGSSAEAAPPTMAVSPEAFPGSSPEPRVAQPQKHSVTELLSLVVDRKLIGLSEKELSEHFAHAGTLRRTPIEDSVTLTIGTPTTQIELNCSAVEGGSLQFHDSTLTFLSPSKEETLAVYKESDAFLRKRYGKATWVDRDPAFLHRKGWDIVRDELAVSLTVDRPEHGGAVRLAFGPVEGEAE